VSVQVFGPRPVSRLKLWVAASRPRALGMAPRISTFARRSPAIPKLRLRLPLGRQDVFTHTGLRAYEKKWQLRGWHGQTRLTVLVPMGSMAQEDTLKLRLGVPPVRPEPILP
jgi:hypothetical protein